MTTQPSPSDESPFPEEDDLPRSPAASDVPDESRMPDTAVLQLPPNAVQFPTPGDFTLAGFRRDVSPLIGQLLQPKWLSVVVPFALLYLYVAVRMVGRDWFYLGSPLIIQAIVPFLTVWLVWRRRQQVMRRYYELAFVFPDDSPKRRGKIWPLLLAVALLGVATIVQLPQLGVLGLLIGAVSIVYYLFGALQLQSLWQMLAFLVFTIPPPLGMLARAVYILQVGQATLAAMIAKLFDRTAEVRADNVLHLATSNLVVTPALSGITVVIPVFVLTVWLAILKRIPVLTTLALVVTGFLTAIFANTLRLLALGVLGLESPNPWLVELMTWAIVALSFFVVLRLAVRLTRRPALPLEGESASVEGEDDELTADLDVLLRQNPGAAQSGPVANENR